jgi:CheY-like chemotaxis protein
MNQKILVVEDNPNSREILSLILQRMGHVVIEAYDSKEAIACATAEREGDPGKFCKLRLA